jgi:hypothetical protein
MPTSKEGKNSSTYIIARQLWQFCARNLLWVKWIEHFRNSAFIMGAK